MVVFTESKAIQPEDWRLIGAGQAFVPRKQLRLLVWGIVYETPMLEDTAVPLVDVLLSEGGKTQARYIK